MSSRLRVLAILSAFLSAGLSCTGPFINKDNVRTSIVKNVKLEIKIPKLNHRGNSVGLAVKLSNASQHPVLWGRENYLRELNIHVLNSSYIASDVTSYGEREWAPESPYKKWSQLSYKPIEPGQHTEWNVDLNSLFNLHRGTYFVSVAIELNRDREPFTVYASGLEFTIQ